MPQFDRTSRFLVYGLILILCLLVFTSMTYLRARTPSSTSIPAARVLPTTPPNIAEMVVTPQQISTSAPSPTPLPSLRQLVLPRGLVVGVSVAPAWLEEPAYSSLLTQNFNAVTPENAMKWEVVHPQPDVYDFTQADAIVEYARQNDLLVRGHTLVWGNQLPDWVKQGNYSREQWIEILRQHITTVVGRYKGQVYAWDVVNEAVGEDGELFNNFWLQVIGPDYIPLAFEFAQAADPDALLFYNDNGGEGLNAKSDSIYRLAQGLMGLGAPIDGVGLQMHVGLGASPSPDELSANLQRLANLGLQTQITEMDVRIQSSDAPMEQRLAEQAEIYRQVFALCLQSPNCTAFFTWGLTDQHSWIPSHTGNPDAPLLFDENYQAKPAYDSIIWILKEPETP